MLPPVCCSPSAVLLILVILLLSLVLPLRGAAVIPLSAAPVLLVPSQFFPVARCFLGGAAVSAL